MIITIDEKLTGYAFLKWVKGQGQDGAAWVLWQEMAGVPRWWGQDNAVRLVLEEIAE